MSGKAKTAQKAGGKDRGPSDQGYKHERVDITHVLEFRRNSRGNLVPKYRWEVR